MRKIFKMSKEVLIWLGPKSVFTDAALRYLSSPKFWRSKRPPTFRAELGIRLILQHPYWLKAWVIQEIANARSAFLLCGDRRIRWSRFVDVLDHIFPFWLKEEYNPSIQTPKNQIWTINHFRQTHNLGLVEVLEETRCTLASDPRDAIYAKLGLATDSPDLVPEADYLQPIDHILVEVTVQHVLKKQDLYVICLAEPTTKGLPSWAPEWSKMSHKYPIHGGAINRTDITSLQRQRMSVRFSENHQELRVRGVCFDIVGDAQSFNLQSVDHLREEPRRYVGLMHLKDRRMTKTGHSSVAALQLICQTAAAGQVRTTPRELVQTFALDAARHENGRRGLLNSWYKKNASVRFGTKTIQQWATDYVQHGFKPTGRYGVHDNKLSLEILSPIFRMSRQRKTVETVTQNVILAPEATQQGNMVCILFGCPVPVVLRPQRGFYELLGACYVDDMMRDQIFDDIEKGHCFEHDFNLR